MKSIIAFTLLVAAFDSTCIAQQEFPVSVTIATSTPIAKSGADIRVDVTVVNTSDHSLRILRSPDGHAEAISQIEVRDADGNIPSFLSTGWQKGMAIKKVSVEPGESNQAFLILTKLYDLAKPGNYTVRLRHEYYESDPSSSNLKRILVPSNTITINVTE